MAKKAAQLWYNLPGVLAAYQPGRCPGGELLARSNMAHGGDSRFRLAAVSGVALPTWHPATGYTFGASAATALDTGVPASGVSRNYEPYTIIAAFTGLATGTQRQFLIGAGGRFDADAMYIWALYQTYNTRTGNHAYADNSFTARARAAMALSGRTVYRYTVEDGLWWATGGYDHAGALSTTFKLGYDTSSGAAAYYGHMAIHAAAIYGRELSQAEVDVVLRQMHYCVANPEWSVWEPERRYWAVGPEVVGGAEYPQAAAGAQTNTGALVRKTAKPPTGSQTNTGTIGRNVGKPLAGSI